MIDVDLARLIKETIRAEVEKAMRLRVSELAGKGGDTTISSMGNIYLRTILGKKAYYKGVEIATGEGGGSLSDYMKKAPATTQNMYNSIRMKTAHIIQFEAGGGNLGGYLFAFEGQSIYDLALESPNGYLYLKGVQGIRLESTIVTDATFAQKVYLNAAQTAWITMNGNILEFHIPGGKWRVVPE